MDIVLETNDALLLVTAHINHTFSFDHRDIVIVLIVQELEMEQEPKKAGLDSNYETAKLCEQAERYEDMAEVSLAL